MKKKLKLERCTRSEAQWSHLSLHHNPSEALLRGQWAQQNGDFRTYVFPRLTLFISLRKAWAAKQTPSQIIQHTHTHKPHYSHLPTMRAAHDALKKEGCCNTDQQWADDGARWWKSDCLCNLKSTVSVSCKIHIILQTLIWLNVLIELALEVLRVCLGRHWDYQMKKGHSLNTGIKKMH